jgi:hypothetical protein
MMTSPFNWQQKFSKSPSESDDGDLQNVVLVRGKDMQAEPQWAYALIPADNYLAFRQAESEGNYSLADFGEVLHFGAGENPPEDIAKEMAENYGADPKFEEELLAVMDEALDSVLNIFNPESEEK